MFRFRAEVVVNLLKPWTAEFEKFEPESEIIEFTIMATVLETKVKTWSPTVPCKISDNIVSSQFSSQKIFIPSYERYVINFHTNLFISVKIKRMLQRETSLHRTALD